MKPDQFRQRAKELMRFARKTGQDHPAIELLVDAEGRWVKTDRPFYNIWPVVSELASSVKLDLPFSAVEPPFEVMVLRFAKGNEPFGMTTSMMWWLREDPDKSAIGLFPFSDDFDTQDILPFVYSDPDTPVEKWIEDMRCRKSNFGSLHEHLIRLTVFVGLLANDQDFITPIVLAKDREKYDSTTDDDVRQAIERRAMRRLGRGFDVGKAIQLEKEQTPHWRNPHLALFWTGRGRLKPIIKMRSGAIIHRVSMAEVPTGYLGPETSKDAELVHELTERVAISGKKRFEIFKRDAYRCQLCGAKADDGAALHVDHRLAVAKGGSNDDDNLWTLCDRCNLGKSDADL